MIITLFACLTMINSCNTSAKETEQHNSERAEQADTIQKQVYEDAFGDSYLLGRVNEQILREESFYNWFKEAENYEPKEEVTEQLKQPLQEFELEVFFGTWCSDSHQHIPKLIRILEQTAYELDRVTMITVGDEGEFYKKSPDGEHEGKQIDFVPTIIFYKNGEEVNRIVETPVNTLEEDMLLIATGQTYSHKYAD